jgi:ribosomal subunit interface protein
MVIHPNQPFSSRNNTRPEHRFRSVVNAASGLNQLHRTIVGRLRYFGEPSAHLWFLTGDEVDTVTRNATQTRDPKSAKSACPVENHDGLRWRCADFNLMAHRESLPRRTWIEQPDALCQIGVCANIVIRRKLMTFTWHSTTRNIHAENLGQKFENRLDLIKKHLTHFPQGTVHLDISVEKNLKKDWYTAKLHLRLPARILNATKEADNMMTAFDRAADALVREVKKHKSELRGDANWDRRERRDGATDKKVLWFQAVPEFVSNQPIPEMLVEMLAQHRTTVLSNIVQMIRQYEMAGRVPANSVNADAILQTVIERSLNEYPRKPARKTYKGWFEVLAKEELNRRYEALRARPVRRELVAA